MSTTPTDAELDRIENEIYITADLPTVWALVSRPGWWINDEAVDPEPDLRTDGDESVLTHPEWGEFALRTVEATEPSYVAFRWLSGPGAELTDDSTLVEFWLEQRVGGVVLKVAESGFSAMPVDRDVWLERRENNVEGWANELKAARAFVTRDRG